MKKRKGFTLIELVVVIAIIGILASVLIPGYNYFIKKSRISNAETEATNLTLLLKANAVYDNVDSYSTSKVLAIANENGYELKSSVKGYAYFYDPSLNSVFYKEIKKYSDQATKINSIKKVKNDTLIFSPYNLFEGSNVSYIDQTSNEILDMIDTINYLSLYGNGNVTKMQELYDTKMNELQNVSSFSIVKTHFEKFSLDNTVYVSETGAYTKTTNSSAYVFIEEGTIVLNTSVNTSVSVSSLNDVFIPSTVLTIKENALPFLNTATNILLANPSVEIEGNNDNLNAVKYSNENTMKVTRLTNDDIILNYEDSNKFEGRDLNNITTRIFEPRYDEVENCYYGKLEKNSAEVKLTDIVSVYKVPSVKINNKDKKFADVQNVVLKSNIQDNGSVVYTVVMVDSTNNAYYIDNIGYITEAEVFYSRDENTTQKEIEISLPRGFESETSFGNIDISKVSVQIDYQYGHDYFTEKTNIYNGETYYISGMIDWEQQTSYKKVNYEDLVNHKMVIDLSGKEINDNPANILNIYSIRVLLNDSEIYRRTYEKLVSDQYITVTYYSNNENNESNTYTYVSNSYVNEKQLYKYYGHTQTSWNTKPDGSGVTYGYDEYIAIPESSDLYAIWSENIYTVIVRDTYLNIKDTSISSSLKSENYGEGLPLRGTIINIDKIKAMTQSGAEIKKKEDLGWTLVGVRFSANTFNQKLMKFDENGNISLLDLVNLFQNSGPSIEIILTYEADVTLNFTGGSYKDITEFKFHCYMYESYKNYLPDSITNLKSFTLTKEGYTHIGWNISPEHEKTITGTLSTIYSAKMYALWSANS